MTELPADLERLIATLRTRTGPSALPPIPYQRDAGEPEDHWRRRLHRARAAHDAHAIARRDAVDAVARDLFGADVSGLLPEPGPLARWAITVPIDPARELEDLVPEAAGVLPRGPGIRVSEPVDRLRVQITAPLRARGGIVRLHGGGYWMGGGETAQRIDRPLIDHLAGRLGAVVFDLDYRLAPEYPFPAAVLDTLIMIDRARERADEYGIDPDRIALVGTSSGAHTAVLASRLDALRRPGHPLAALALVAPSVDASNAPPALRGDPEAWELRQRQLRGYLGSELPATDPWVSPALEPALEGMPPTFAAIAEFDEIALGGEALVHGIAEGGGTARARRYPMTHTVAAPGVEAEMIEDLADFLGERIGASTP